MKNEAPRCPDCGGVLQVVTDGLVGEKRTHVHGNFAAQYFTYSWVMQPRPFAACSSCEFCIEINR